MCCSFESRFDMQVYLVYPCWMPKMHAQVHTCGILLSLMSILEQKELITDHGLPREHILTLTIYQPVLVFTQDGTMEYSTQGYNNFPSIVLPEQHYIKQQHVAFTILTAKNASHKCTSVSFVNMRRIYVWTFALCRACGCHGYP